MTGWVIRLMFAYAGGLQSPGTASLIAEEPRIWQVDVSVCDFDR